MNPSAADFLRGLAVVAAAVVGTFVASLLTWAMFDAVGRMIAGRGR